MKQRCPAEARLEERPFCVVFEDDLKRCWPSDQMPRAKRNSEIHRFAESQGWVPQFSRVRSVQG
jgi:hypothetical protein